MSGFLLAIGVNIFLTLISGGFIWYSRQIPGPASLAIVQAGMFVKLMLGGTIALAVIKLTNVNVIAFGMTMGVYACVAFPIIAYLMVKNDFTQRQ